MNPDLRSVATHMRELGLGSLRHAMRLSLYAATDNPWLGEISILNAAHAAEILIKARIAEEHPLLIFEKLPKPDKERCGLLEIQDLFEKGRTVQYQDLPEWLWATTGIRLPCEREYSEFGRLRNSIQHFAAPSVDTRQKTLEFVFKVLDPFIHDEWGLFAIDFNEEFDDHYEDVFGPLVSMNLRPLISPRAACQWSRLEYTPGPESPPGYAEWFQKAIEEALRATPKKSS